MWKRVNGGRKPPKIPLTHFSLKKGWNKNRSLPNPWVSVHPWQPLSFVFRKAGYHCFCNTISWHPRIWDRQCESQGQRQEREGHLRSTNICQALGGEISIIISFYYHDSWQLDIITLLLYMEKLEFWGNERIAQGRQNNGVSKACMHPHCSVSFRFSVPFFILGLPLSNSVSEELPDQKPWL